MAQEFRNGREKDDSGTVGTRPRSLSAGSDRRWRRASAAGLHSDVAAGSEAYDRRRTLPRLIALDPRELEAGGESLDRSILARLKRALRAERRRGQAGHWTYDLNRHLGLLQALAGEEGRARAERADRVRPAPPIRRSRDPETRNAARSAGRRS